MKNLPRISRSIATIVAVAFVILQANADPIVLNGYTFQVDHNGSPDWSVSNTTGHSIDLSLVDSGTPNFGPSVFTENVINGDFVTTVTINVSGNLGSGAGIYVDTAGAFAGVAFNLRSTGPEIAYGGFDFGMGGPLVPTFSGDFQLGGNSVLGDTLTLQIIRSGTQLTTQFKLEAATDYTVLYSVSAADLAGFANINLTNGIVSEEIVGATASFSNFSFVPAPVPDSGDTVLLLGMALPALLAFRRKVARS